MTTFARLNGFKPTNLFTASKDLESVMRLTPEHSWKQAVENLLNEWGELSTLADSISPENMKGHESLIEKVKRESMFAMKALEDEVMDEFSFKEIIKSKGIAHEFSLALKDITSNYSMSSSEMMSNIAAMDNLINTAKTSPAAFISTKGAEQDRLFKSLIEVSFKDNPQVSEALRKAQSEAYTQPAASIPVLLANYEYGRKKLIESNPDISDSLFDLTRLDERNRLGASALKLNENAIREVLEDNELKDSSSFASHLEVPFYSDLGIFITDIPQDIEVKLTEIGLALGNNLVTQDLVSELENDLQEITRLAQSIKDDADYLYERRAEIQEFCNHSLEDVAVYSSSNTDWYIMYFDEDTKELGKAKQISEECIAEANRLDENMSNFNAYLNDFEMGFNKLETTLVRELEKSASHSLDQSL